MEDDELLKLVDQKRRQAELYMSEYLSWWQYAHCPSCKPECLNGPEVHGNNGCVRCDCKGYTGEPFKRSTV